MITKRVTICLLLAGFSFTCGGRDFRSKISVQTGYSYLIGGALSERKGGVFNMPGISFQREVRDNIGLRISLSVWNPSFINGYKTDEVFFEMLDTNQLVGSKLRLKGYKFIDLSVYYSHSYKTHTACVVLGPSFAFGTTQYITNYYINPDPPVDMVIYYEEKKEVLLGIVGGLNYNVSFLKNRLSAGPFANFRYYPKLFPQLDFGIQLGYRF